MGQKNKWGLFLKVLNCKIWSEIIGLSNGRLNLNVGLVQIILYNSRIKKEFYRMIWYRICEVKKLSVTQ